LPEESGEEALFNEAEEEIFEEETEKPKEKPVPSMQTPKREAQSFPAESLGHVDLNKLWETGVLTTVDAKLEEMKTLKKDIDAVIDARVQASIEKESGKIRGFFEAQRDLNASRMNSLIKEKTEEFNEALNAKLAELKQLNITVQANASKLDAKQQMSIELLNSINEKIAELEKLKARLSSSMNAELIEAKRKVEGFVIEAQKKLTDLDLRVTRTLELESKIAEGLLKDAENKISVIVDQKTASIDKKITAKITELNSIQERVDPKKVEQKLAQLVAEATSKIDELVSEKTQPLVSEVEAKINDLSTLQSRVDPKLMENRIFDLEKRFQKDSEALNQKMQDFNLFKEQFIAIVEKNTNSFNKSIKEFNGQKQKTNELIDAKIKELENFEKKFAEEMGLMIEDIAKKPKTAETSIPEKKKKK
jgi:hypothetical protein